MKNICLECGTELFGRVDKKYCSDYCRNAYHNKQNKDETNFVNKLNRILRKNRRILKNLTPEGKAIVSKMMLEKEGFIFKYYTHVYKTKEGKVYYFCYEHGYLPLENDYFALVVNKDI